MNFLKVRPRLTKTTNPQAVIKRYEYVQEQIHEAAAFVNEYHSRFLKNRLREIGNLDHVGIDRDVSDTDIYFL